MTNDELYEVINSFRKTIKRYTYTINYESTSRKDSNNSDIVSLMHVISPLYKQLKKWEGWSKSPVGDGWFVSRYNHTVTRMVNDGTINRVAARYSHIKILWSHTYLDQFYDKQVDYSIELNSLQLVSLGTIAQKILDARRDRLVRIQAEKVAALAVYNDSKKTFINSLTDHQKQLLITAGRHRPQFLNSVSIDISDILG